MTELDFDKVQPLRLAVGTHKAGSGYGCAMNVVSYMNGDSVITDYPTCSDRDMARLVQLANDLLGQLFGKMEADNRQTLAPEDAVTVIRLGILTIGTALHGPGRARVSNPYNNPFAVPAAYDFDKAYLQYGESDFWSMGGAIEQPPVEKSMSKYSWWEATPEPPKVDFQMWTQAPCRSTFDGIRVWREVENLAMLASTLKEVGDVNTARLRAAQVVDHIEGALLAHRKSLGLDAAPEVSRETVNSTLIFN